MSAATTPEFEQTELTLTVRPIYGAPDGWLARLFELGVKASSRKERFGAEKWVFKLDGTHVLATQDYHYQKTVVFTNPTAGQKAIVEALIGCGLAISTTPKG